MNNRSMQIAVTRAFQTIGFRLMALMFRIRDFLRQPVRLLRQTCVGDLMTVLDFGCGPGGFTIAAAKLVSSQGLVYAFDTHPLALRYVETAIARKDIQNVKIIGGNAFSQIPGESLDMCLLYDVLHDLAEPVKQLSLIYSVPKPRGVLSVSDHHLDEESIIQKVTASRLFIPTGRSQRSFRFNKA